MGGLCMANGDTDKLGFGAARKPAAVPLGTTSFKLHDARWIRQCGPCFPPSRT